MTEIERFISNLEDAFRTVGRDVNEIYDILRLHQTDIDAAKAGGSGGGAPIVDGQPGTTNTWSGAFIAEQLGFNADIANGRISEIEDSIGAGALAAQFRYAYLNTREQLELDAEATGIKLIAQSLNSTFQEVGRDIELLYNSIGGFNNMIQEASEAAQFGYAYFNPNEELSGMPEFPTTPPTGPLE